MGEDDTDGGQLQMSERDMKRKKKRQDPDLIFKPEMVFDLGKKFEPKPAVDLEQKQEKEQELEIPLDTARYKAQHGEAGDRKQGGGPPDHEVSPMPDDATPRWDDLTDSFTKAAEAADKAGKSLNKMAESLKKQSNNLKKKIIDIKGEYPARIPGGRFA